MCARCAVSVEAEPAEASCDLDIDVIERAIKPHIRIAVVNTPHNPTGVIYSRDRLRQLAEMLIRKSTEYGRLIFILSDEPHRRIWFDGVGFTRPAEVYPWTLVDYSYGKILPAPGLRLRYLAVGLKMPENAKEQLRLAVENAPIAGG